MNGAKKQQWESELWIWSLITKYDLWRYTMYNDICIYIYMSYTWG